MIRTQAEQYKQGDKVKWGLNEGHVKEVVDNRNGSWSLLIDTRWKVEGKVITKQHKIDDASTVSKM